MLDMVDGVSICRPDEDGEGIVVKLYPSPSAYGWGYEPDTRRAMQFLLKNVTPGITVADIGGGTGILAILAARLGAQVTVYEIKDDVRETIERNVELNDVQVKVLGEYDGATGFDIAVSNLGDVDYKGMGILDSGRKVWTTNGTDSVDGVDTRYM